MDNQSSDIVMTLYVSVGVSQHCMDWGKNDLIIYAASNSIYVYDPKCGAGGSITQTLCFHESGINCLSWIGDEKGTPETEFIIGSADFTISVWRKTQSGYEIVDHLQGHSQPVSVVACLYFDSPAGEGPYTIVASAGEDERLIIYKRNFGSDKFEQIHSLNIRDCGLCFSAKLHKLTNVQSPLLVLSTDHKLGKLVLLTFDDTSINKLTHLGGHTDWIRDLDFVRLDDGDSLLATASQDNSVRLWKFALPKDSIGNEEKFQLSLKPTTIKIDSTEISVLVETVLQGHEDKVWSVQWSSTCSSYDDLKLLTSSYDRSIIEWSPDPDSGVWFEKIRLGEIGGDRLGFMGARYNPTATCILAYTFHQAFHKWKIEDGNWIREPTIGGHGDVVTDIAWEREGRYLLSCSHDQTTRLHACWKNKSDSTSSWHEISRPQIHGYEMVCLTTLPNFNFVSAGDEKICRAFTAPRYVLENLNKLCDLGLDETILASGDFQPSGATVPALGLSNKAIFIGDEHVDKKKKIDEDDFVPQIFDFPPTEEMLQSTLWPETMKLYGHGNNIYSLASSNNGALLASACKASNKVDAQIIIWQTSTWDKIQTLEAHTLTVVKMAFSPDDTKLISVSRDRTWTLFTKDDSGEFMQQCKSPSGIHTRIIFDCAWTHNSKYFATGSRDGVIAGWTAEGKLSGSLKNPLNDAVITALDWAPVAVGNDKYLLAAGLESGVIEFFLYTVSISSPWTLIYTINKNFHTHSITRLQFKPVDPEEKLNLKEKLDDTLILASSSNDHSVRISAIKYNQIINNEAHS